MRCKVKLFILQSFILTIFTSINAKPRIKYGEISEQSYPFMAFLFIGKIEETPYEISMKGFDCAGSLIIDNWILTAGHCVYSIKDDKDLQENQIIAYFGSNERPNILDTTNWNGYVTKATEFIIHERMIKTKTRIMNDIALIKLENPVPAEWGSPIAMPRRGMTDELMGRTAIVIGWGQTESSKNSKQLREAKIKLSDSNYCRERNFICQITKVNVFAEVNPTNVPGTGHGDSGGPLLLKIGNNWMLIGVVSGEIILVDDIGDEFILDTYADVSKYLDWISKHI